MYLPKIALDIFLKIATLNLSNIHREIRPSRWCWPDGGQILFREALDWHVYIYKTLLIAQGQTGERKEHQSQEIWVLALTLTVQFPNLGRSVLVIYETKYPLKSLLGLKNSFVLKPCARSPELLLCPPYSSRRFLQSHWRKDPWRARWDPPGHLVKFLEEVNCKFRWDLRKQNNYPCIINGGKLDTFKLSISRSKIFPTWDNTVNLNRDS